MFASGDIRNSLPKVGFCGRFIAMPAGASLFNSYHGIVENGTPSSPLEAASTWFANLECLLGNQNFHQCINFIYTNDTNTILSIPMNTNALPVTIPNILSLELYFNNYQYNQSIDIHCYSTRTSLQLICRAKEAVFLQTFQADKLSGSSPKRSCGPFGTTPTRASAFISVCPYGLQDARRGIQ